MKKSVLFLFLALGGMASADTTVEISNVERSSALFSMAIHHPELMGAMRQTEGSEIVSVKQVFILAGRVSHTNYEITIGVPDGVGGFSSVRCLPLTLCLRHPVDVYDTAEAEYFLPAQESCR
jgi:hypothetical protein